jgi:chondroitin AC lyase
MASVNIASNRTIRTESGNGENLNGQFLTEGAMNIAIDGDEYFNIFPIWKWYMIPGTTTPANQKLRKRTNWVAEPGNVDFVGGVSDGQNGIATYAMDAYRTQAKKAWFFFDNRIICLGSSITADRPEPIYTTINQSWLKGNVWKITEGNPSKIEAGNHQLQNEQQWIFHDNIAYFITENQNLKLSTEKQVGAWSAINSGSSSKKIEKNVFTLWIDHQLNPKNAVYQYIVFPGVSSPEVVDIEEPNNIQILKNDQSIQAVWDKKNDLIGAVLYDSGALKWDQNQLKIDQPGVILVSKKSSGEWTISYSDPTQKLTGKVTGSIKINGQSRDLMIVLPQGMKAGSTVAYNLTL